MATYSRAELRNAVLHELGVLDAAEAAEAEDAEIADARCQQKLEMLADDGLVQFNVDGTIPARYFIPLVRVIADTLAMPYGVGDRLAVLAQNAERGMRDLYRLKAQPHYGQITKGTYY